MSRQSFIPQRTLLFSFFASALSLNCPEWNKNMKNMERFESMNKSIQHKCLCQLQNEIPNIFAWKTYIYGQWIIICSPNTFPRLKTLPEECGGTIQRSILEVLWIFFSKQQFQWASVYTIISYCKTAVEEGLTSGWKKMDDQIMNILLAYITD